MRSEAEEQCTATYIAAEVMPMRTSQPTQPAPRIKPEFSTPPGKLLGKGQDYTATEALQDAEELRRRYTPAVHRLAEWTEEHCERSRLNSATQRLRQRVDVLNERIESGAFGGAGEATTNSGLPVPGIIQDRVNAELGAQGALRRLRTGALGEALAVVECTIELLNAGESAEKELDTG